MLTNDACINSQKVNTTAGMLKAFASLTGGYLGFCLEYNPCSKIKESRGFHSLLLLLHRKGYLFSPSPNEVEGEGASYFFPNCESTFNNAVTIYVTAQKQHTMIKNA